ncbi:tetratricopeptide repeat protein [bacterium]|nr:tetratricopeptide repeat protein [bacterium]
MSESGSRRTKSRRYAVSTSPAERNNSSKKSITNFSYKRLMFWFVLSIPAVFGVLTCITTIARLNERQRSTNDNLRSLWPEVIADGKWKDSYLIARRLIASRRFEIPDFMAYFDTLIALGDQAEAIAFLNSFERSKPASELPIFRLKFAERLMQLAPADPEKLSDAVNLIRQALAGGLPRKEDFLARRLLASQAYASADYDRAIDLLKPLENESVDIAVELAWIRWIKDIDGDTTAARSEAKRIFDELMRQVSQRKKFRLVNPTPQELADIEMLLVILGRDQEFFDVIRELIVLSPAERDRAKAELQEYRLNAEFKKKNPEAALVAQILLGKLAEAPGDVNALQQAITVWASLPPGSDAPIAKWVNEYLASDQADVAQMHFAGDICRRLSRWDDARRIYTRILEKSPGDFVAENNLAETLYKTRPFDYAKAIALTDNALKGSPGNVAILETRGQVLARMGKYQEAIDVLEKCIAHYPKDWNLRNTLVQLYERTRDEVVAEGHRRVLAELERPPGTEAFANLP